MATVRPDDIVIYGESAALALDVREQLTKVKTDLEALQTLIQNAEITGAATIAATTNVAGTGTAYTADSAITITTDAAIWFSPHTTNTGAATLSINGGTARAIRNMNGAVLSANQLQSGYTYLLRFTGSLFVVIGLLLQPDFRSRVNLIGNTSTLDFYNAGTESFPQGRLLVTSGGQWYFYAGGDGTALGDLALQIDTSGNLRSFAEFRNAKNRPLYSDINPPDYNETAHERENYIISPWWERASEAVSISSTRPYNISGADLGRHIRVSVAGAWLDFEAMPVNTNIIVDIQSGASATLYSGYTGFTWRGFGGTRLNAPASSMVMVIKGQTDITAFAFNGTLTTTAISIPTYSRKIAFFPGQSWAERETKNAYKGLQDRLTALSLNRDTLVVQNVAAGASALLIGAPTDTSNYWWDPASGSPSAVSPASTNTADALAAVAAAPASPDLTDCFVMYGLNDLSVFDSTGDNTPAIWTQAQLDLQDYIRTQLSLPNLRFWICPIPAQDLGTFAENKWYAMRRAQLDVVASDANSYRGPDYYDLPRPYGDRHHSYVGQAEHGARIANFMTNVTDGKSNYLGPKIVSFARTGANTYVVTIDFAGGLNTQRPVSPVGFAIVPGGDLFAEPLTIAPGGYTWGTSGSFSTLTITTTTDDATADLCYPYGSFYECKDITRVVRALDPVHATWMPLQTYHPTV